MLLLLLFVSMLIFVFRVVCVECVRCFCIGVIADVAIDATVLIFFCYVAVGCGCCI